MNTPPAPSRHFAGMFAELEASLTDERRDWFNNRHAMLLDNLIACIREQQAALAGVIRVADRATDEFDAAHAALRKWRIE